MMFQPRKILTPTDFSNHAERAFDMALSIASRYQARVFLLHVINNSIQQYAGDYGIDKNTMERVMSEIIVFVNEKLKETLLLDHDPRQIKVIQEVRHGKPSEEIIKETCERKIDLLVMASHGKTSMNHFLMGSVTERVIQEVKCPVLLMRSHLRKEA
ncbi:MAG TPA: universal stress protein [Smithellaceae bacterium]|nr:universal stress protein [Smithellaceae bacterium]